MEGGTPTFGDGAPRRHPRCAVRAPPWVHPPDAAGSAPLLAAKPPRSGPHANFATAATPALFLPSEGGVRGMGERGEVSREGLLW